MTHKGAAQVVKAFEKVNFVVFGRLGKSVNLGIFTSKWRLFFVSRLFDGF